MTTRHAEHDGVMYSKICAKQEMSVFAEDFPNQHGGIAVQDGGEAEESVEDADAGEVFARAEKGYSFLLWRVIDVDGDGNDVDVAPRRSYQQFQLSFVSRGDDVHLAHFLQRIEPESRLRVRQLFGSLHGEPKVGELVGEGVLLGHVIVLEPAAADDEHVGMLFDRFHKGGNVAGIMLPVGVQRDGIAESAF